MSGNMSRNKGKRGEREIIDALQPIVNQVYATHEREAPVLKRNTLQSDGGGYDIVGLDWFAPEVKYHETFHVEKWWEQCTAQANCGQAPVLLWRCNGMRTWNVRMWGYVEAQSLGLRVPVQVLWSDFLKWFRIRLNEELCNEH
jgi:hypothetical protein